MLQRKKPIRFTDYKTKKVILDLISYPRSGMEDFIFEDEKGKKITADIMGLSETLMRQHFEKYGVKRGWQFEVSITTSKNRTLGKHLIGKIYSIQEPIQSDIEDFLSINKR